MRKEEMEIQEVMESATLPSSLPFDKLQHDFNESQSLPTAGWSTSMPIKTTLANDLAKAMHMLTTWKDLNKKPATPGNANQKNPATSLTFVQVVSEAIPGTNSSFFENVKCATTPSRVQQGQLSSISGS